MYNGNACFLFFFKHEFPDKHHVNESVTLVNLHIHAYALPKTTLERNFLSNLHFFNFPSQEKSSAISDRSYQTLQATLLIYVSNKN